MGVERHIHIGPYIRVSYEKRISRSDNCRMKSECPDSSDPYCPKCGLDSSRRFSTYEVKPEFWDMFDNGEPLASVGEDGESECGTRGIADLRPNNYPLPRDFGGENDLDSTDLDIEAEISWMKEKHSKEISILNEKFGEEHVEVRWGYFSWWY